MTPASYCTASDGTQRCYRCDAFTDPWREAPLAVLLHPDLGSSLRLFGRHNVFDCLAQRCVAAALAFLHKHFPEEAEKP